MTQATPAGSPRQRFRSRLAARPLLVDGGLGTLLFSRGVPQRACLEELVASAFGDGRGRPSRVSRGRRRTDRDPVVRGQPPAAQRLGPRASGSARSTGVPPSSRARRARSAGGTRSSVDRSGRLDRPTEGGQPSTTPPRGPMFREQIEGLLEGGADLIVLETFSDLTQLVLAVDEARRASDVPVIASLTFGEELLLADGSNPAVAVPTLARGWRGRCRGQLRGRTGRLSGCARGDGRCQSMASPRGRSCPTPGSRSDSKGRFIYAASAEYFGTSRHACWRPGLGSSVAAAGRRPSHIAAMRAAWTRPRRRPRVRPRGWQRPPRPPRPPLSTPTALGRRRSLTDRPPAAATPATPHPRPAWPSCSTPANSSSRSRSIRRGASASSGRSRPPGCCAMPASTWSTSRTRRWPASG